MAVLETAAIVAMPFAGTKAQVVLVEGTLLQNHSSNLPLRFSSLFSQKIVG
jgi:hypothetical protein